jgi:hypothetical protein
MMTEHEVIYTVSYKDKHYSSRDLKRSTFRDLRAAYDYIAEKGEDKERYSNITLETITTTRCIDKVKF